MATPRVKVRQPTGRKGKYYTHVEPYLEDIKKLRREGAIEKDIALRLGVGSSTFCDYKIKHPELKEALKGSTLDLANNIRASVYLTAMGGFVKIRSKYKYIQGKKILVSTEEEIMAPNTTAQAIALKIIDPEARVALSTNVQIDNHEHEDNQQSLLEKIKEAEDNG